MRNWRIITAIATVVLAIVAAVLVYAYVDTADQRAQDNVAQVKILVAVADVPAGTAAKLADLQLQSVPKKNLPENYLKSIKTLGDKVAVVQIDKGALITPSMFVAANEAAASVSLRAKLEREAKAMRAVSLSVDPAHGVANLVRVGDSINVIATVDLEATARKDKLKATVTDYVLVNARVLGVGQATSNASLPVPEATTKAGNSTTTTQPRQQNLGQITIAVTNEDALRLAQVIDNGQHIYVSLNSYDANHTKAFDWPKSEVVEAVNLFPRDLKVWQQFVASIPDQN